MSENFKKLKFGIACLGLLLITGLPGISQITTGDLTGEVNTINSAVPFLTIVPDSRGGAMGDVGAATSPDISSQQYNIAKYAFIDGDGGIALSYTPWLRALINDINLAYLVGYKRLDNDQVISASFRYFSLGNITFTDIVGTTIKEYNPNEFALDAGYSRIFGNNISGGIAFRFIRSDLTGGVNAGDAGTKAGISVAADLSTYYKKKVDLGANKGLMGIGANISNIGTKISYTENQEKSFIPINLRVGGSLKIDIDDYNTFTVAADINKLLVPSTPVWYKDSLDAQGNKVVQYGKNPYVSVPQGMLQSFYDAPGVVRADGSRSVLLEELHELTYGIGGEYWYREQFAIRGGYFYEHQTKGNRKFFTLGIGLKLNVFEIDFSYLVPTNQTNPLANTLRFTLAFDFDKFKKAN
ncbi:MAG: type IX secretion system outer membrane channel protein PorV [Bacteroidales bacterium]|nr:type IX secretion system outer membrane channel protein PorV [Bacteroidales bacterium]MCB8999372.1 type IX secretion system outer membrane channel protein PorV [Bacteroidales bacterium]MCB9013385.1 type IX secretion system outer membrane channel protein PorV [Bacteroidales bacterium]